jgi:divalent metal cation (Fe/Co/Zn/Cd) transporter
MVADAAHSLSDLVSDVLTLFAVKLARLPKTPLFPYGFGKFEVSDLFV